MTDGKDAPKWNRLRRTEWKRKPRKPMKRTGKLRQRSKTNSRPGENLELRRAFMAEFDLCQTCLLIHELSDRRWDADDPHHIFGGRPKVDNFANLIAICRRCHDWCHKYPNDGKWVALYAKLRLSESDPRHWNLEELNTAARQRVEGWATWDDKQPVWAFVRERCVPAVLDAIQKGEEQ